MWRISKSESNKYHATPNSFAFRGKFQQLRSSVCRVAASLNDKQWHSLSSNDALNLFKNAVESEDAIEQMASRLNLTPYSSSRLKQHQLIFLIFYVEKEVEDRERGGCPDDARVG